MAKEQSIKNQIAAMEGWAIKAKQNADSGKYEEANELLRTINTQGRRLEWRGGSSGLKHLPDMEEVKALKKKISEARAAAQTAQSSIHHMEKVMGKEKKGSSKEEHFAREKKKAQYQTEITKSLAILIEVTKKANAIAKDEPWINITFLTRKSNYPYLLDFLRGNGYYHYMDGVEKGRLLGPLFKNGFFRGANLWRADLERANLERANLERANFNRAKLLGANLEEAHLEEANLVGADLERANLSGAHLWEADLEEANLYGVRNLTKEQLHSAKNWEKAINIPPDLK